MSVCNQIDPQLLIDYSANKDLFQLFLLHSPVAIAMFDRQMRYIVASSKWLNDYNLGNQNIIGRSYYEVLPKNSIQWKKIHQLCLAGAVVKSEENGFLRGDGKTDWLRWEIHPWRSAGEIGGIVMFTEAIAQNNQELEIYVEERTRKLKQRIDQLKKEISGGKIVEKELVETGGYNSYLLPRCHLGSYVQYLSDRQRVQKERDRFFSLSLDLLCIAGFDGYFKQINPTWEKILGFSQEELKAKPFIEFVHPEDREATLAEAEKVVTGSSTISFENRYLCKDGSYIWLSWKAVSFSEEQIMYATARNITARKQAEKALRESEAQLQQKAQREELLNRVANQIRQSLDLDTILATTVQQIRSLLQVDRCLFIWYLPNASPPAWDVVHEAKNDDLFSVLGYYPADVTGSLTEKLSNLEIYRVNDIETITDPVERQFFLSLGYKSMLDLPIQTASGAIGVVACMQHSYVRSWTDEEVELLQAVCAQLAIAITQAKLYAESQNYARIAQEKAQQLEQTLREQQQTQAQLIQTEKMSSLGQLVAGVAHEINNPVNFIHANLSHLNQYTQDLLRLLDLYQQHYPEPNPVIQTAIDESDLDFLRQDLPKILNSMNIGTARIRQIVLSLRNFSRLDEAEMKPVDIHEGIENTLLILQNRLKAKPDRREIQVIKEYGNLPLIECYAGQMNQVFMNLLSNAIDALEEVMFKSQGNCNHQPPMIRISTEVVNNNWLNVRISDNGYGIKEDVKSRLFDPFFTTKSVGKGTGLGLTISYQIVVEKHGGQLDCISAPGQGAELAIAIPIRQ